MKKGGFNSQDFNLDNYLTLMNIYLNEWQYRRQHLWNLVFKFFYANLVVLFLPNLSNALGVDLSRFPVIMFPVVSAVLSITFLYVTIGVSKRVEAIAKTYANMIKLLPVDLQRVHITSAEIKMGKYFNLSLNPILCCGMFLGLFTLSIVMIIYWY